MSRVHVWNCLWQVLNLFLALLLSSFSSENMKKGQEQDKDGVDDDKDDDERKTKDNQMTAAYERIWRWVKFVKVQIGLLTRRHAVLTGTDHKEQGGLKAMLSSETACDVTTAIRPDSSSASTQSSQPPALLVDCSETQVVRRL